jgi:hypothetical protein
MYSDVIYLYDKWVPLVRFPKEGTIMYSPSNPDYMYGFSEYRLIISQLSENKNWLNRANFITYHQFVRVKIVPPNVAKAIIP